MNPNKHVRSGAVSMYDNRTMSNAYTYHVAPVRFEGLQKPRVTSIATETKCACVNWQPKEAFQKFCCPIWHHALSNSRFPEKHGSLHSKHVHREAGHNQQEHVDIEHYARNGIDRFHILFEKKRSEPRSVLILALFQWPNKSNSPVSSTQLHQCCPPHRPK